MNLLNSLGRDTIIYGTSDFMVKMIVFVSFPFIAASYTIRFWNTRVNYDISWVMLPSLRLWFNNALHRFYWDIDTNKKRNQN